MQKLSLTALSLSLTLLLAQGAVCQDQARGRLPDGRAYRTDKQGNQLVDYIAELELNNEALNRQVGGMQEELQDKEQTIERLQRGRKQAEGLVERDLTATGEGEKRIENVKGSDESVAVKCPQVVCPELSCPAPKDCSAEVDRANKGFDGVKLDLERREQTRQQEAQEYRSKIDSLTTLLAARDQEISLLRAKVNETAAELNEARVAARTVQAEEDARASLRAEETESAIEEETSERHEVKIVPQYEDTQTMSLARSRAIESVRSKIMTDLNKLQALISTRDRQFEDYNRRGGSVKFKPTTPVSSRRYTVATIRKLAGNAQNVYEISGLARDIGEIRSKVGDDLALVRRLAKS